VPQLKLPVPGRIPPPQRDEGAVTTLFALLLSSLIVVGMLALVVDIGRLYIEREELQNGADSAALAAARGCAQDERCDPSDLLSAAAAAARANARDGAAQTTLRCLRVAGVTPMTCPYDDTQLTRCVGPRPSSGNFVEIRTSTETEDGSTLLPATFGSALLGESYQGTRAMACARAAWGALSAHPRAFRLGVHSCVFEGSPAPAFVPLEQIKAGTPDPAGETGVHRGLCAAEGSSPPEDDSVFAWLGASGDDCFQKLEAGTAQPGSEITPGWAAACRVDGRELTLDALFSENREPLVLPVYEPAAESGGGNAYHIVGFAYFLPTGYWFGPHDFQNSWSTGSDCDMADAETPQPCLIGFFTKGTLVGAVGPGDGYGLQAIQLIG